MFLLHTPGFQLSISRIILHFGGNCKPFGSLGSIKDSG